MQSRPPSSRAVRAVRSPINESLTLVVITFTHGEGGYGTPRCYPSGQVGGGEQGNTLSLACMFHILEIMPRGGYTAVMGGDEVM